MRKSEITITLCLQITPKQSPASIERYAQYLQRHAESLLKDRGGKIVHSRHHVRTWSEHD